MVWDTSACEPLLGPTVGWEGLKLLKPAVRSSVSALNLKKKIIYVYGIYMAYVANAHILSVWPSPLTCIIWSNFHHCFYEALASGCLQQRIKSSSKCLCIKNISGKIACTSWPFIGLLKPYKWIKCSARLEWLPARQLKWFTVWIRMQRGIRCAFDAKPQSVSFRGWEHLTGSAGRRGWWDTQQRRLEKSTEKLLRSLCVCVCACLMHVARLCALYAFCCLLPPVQVASHGEPH